ncbi:MAG: hypothetical protein EOO27_22510 [Comamonadaceae bacterium]|nr:MAG: hypothetical protein EOO27_22510 [Comamonadaceae bacterium]
MRCSDGISGLITDVEAVIHIGRPQHGVLSAWPIEKPIIQKIMASSFGLKISKAWNSLPSSARLVLWAVCIPLLLSGIGHWEYRQYAQPGLSAEQQQLLAEVTDAEAAVRENPRTSITIDGQQYNGFSAALKLNQIAKSIRGDSASRTQVAAVVRPASIVAMVAGVLTALVALAGLYGVHVAGRQALQSRDALMDLFARWRRLLPTYLTVHMGLLMATVGSLLVVRLGVAYQVVVLERAGSGEAKFQLLVLLAAGTVLWGGVTLLRALYKSLQVLQDDPSEVMGVAVSRHEAPALWAYVDTLAQRAGAAAPAHLVVGLTDGFYVTAHAMQLVPGGQQLTGETMYLPLTYLTLLQRDEISAILAHELGHFAGADTAYSLKFSPIYQGLVGSLQAIHEREDSSEWMDLPATSFIEYLLERFDLAVKHWSREREFAADQVAARLVSGEAVASSLVRVTALHEVVNNVLSEIGRRPQEAGSDLVQMLHDAVRDAGLKAPDFATEVATVHPTDTHPPTLERAKAVNAPVTDAMVQGALVLPDDQALVWVRSLFADSQGLQARLLADFKGVAQERHDRIRKDLADTVAQTRGAMDVYERKNNIWLFGVLSAFVLAAFAGLVLTSLAPGKSLAKSWQIIAGTLAAGLIFAGFAGWFWRRSSVMLMQLTPDGLIVPGWPQMVPWAFVRSYSSTLVNESNLIMTFDLHADSPRLQTPHKNLGRIAYQAKKNKLVVSTSKVRGMELNALHDTVGNYVSGWYAQQHLQSM